MSDFDYTSQTGANRLEIALTGELEIKGGRWMSEIGEECYNSVPSQKAKRTAKVYFGSLDMNKQTNAKGRVNQTHVEAARTYIDTCAYDVEVCFSWEDMRGEHDIIGPTAMRMSEASDRNKERAALDALFGDIMTGTICKPTVFKDICHIPHGGVGITPEKVLLAAQAIKAFHPMSQVMIGITNETTFDMTQFDQWTNNDFLYGNVENAYSGMISKWNAVTFKKIPDFRRMENLEDDPMGNLEPIIHAVPYIDPATGTWDRESFVRFPACLGKVWS